MIRGPLELIRFLLILLLLFVFGGALQAADRETVLILYKSGEKDTPQTSLGGRFAEKPLRDLGYNVEYRDISKGLPDETTMKRCRGIVTWYRTPLMPDPYRYILWLREQIKAGRKVVVMGNFGAHSEDGKTWLTNEDLNDFFYYLGLEYRAAFAGKPEVLEIEKKVSSLVEAEIPLLPSELNFYLSFRSANPENLPYLVIKRKDIPEGSSALVVRTPFGGMAQETYILKELPDNKVAWRLSIREFLRECLTYVPRAVTLPQKTILGLYKADENATEKDNEVRRFAFQPLYDLGYEIALWDIDRGLPDDSRTKNVSAILTWFRGATMRNAPDYYEWLIRMMASGKKVIILGNFGAFQDRIERKNLTLLRWTGKEEYNNFLYPFGLDFEGQWTNKQEILKIVHKDPAMVEYQIPLRDEDIKHFFLFRDSSKENVPYLVVERTDLKSKSSLIVRTPTGGSALESYLYTQDPKTWQMQWRLNLHKFFEECLTYKSTHKLEELLPPDPTLGEIPADAAKSLKQYPVFGEGDIPKGKSEYTGRVLSLFKKSEERNTDTNLVHIYLETVLNHLGLRVFHHDIESRLPDDKFMKDYLGIVTWYESSEMKNPQAYCDWIVRQINQGKKVMILGSFGATVDRDTKLAAPGALEVYKAMGLKLLSEDAGEALHLGLDLLPRTVSRSRIGLVSHDPEMSAFETPLDLSKIRNYSPVVSVSPANKVYCKVDTPVYGKIDPICITPHGGIADGDFAFYEPETHVTGSHWALHKEAPEKKEGEEQEKEQEESITGFWRINPFRFASEALAVQDKPRLDVTTLNGSRVFYSHIDGDGLKGISLIDKSSYSSEFVQEEILKKYPLPVGISYVTSDFERNVAKYYNKVLLVARKIFALYNTEPATHTFSHPFSWRGGDLVIESTYPKVSMERKPIQPHKEIVYSINFLNRRVCPPGKKVEVLYWSGDCFPDARQIAIVGKMGCLNLNGGDPVFDSLHPSYSTLCALTSQVGDQIQVYTSGSNDFIYTDGWTKNFDGMGNLVDHFNKTESPRRVMPINIYYHFYIGDRKEGLDGLRRAYDYALKGHVAPLFPSEYVAIVHDFLKSRIFETGDGGWIVLNSGDLRTVRFDAPSRFPDLERSSGVLGYVVINGSLYIHLDESTSHTIYLSEKEPGHPYIRYGSHHISRFRGDNRSLSFEVFGTGRSTYEIANLVSGASYEVKLKSTNSPEMLTEKTIKADSNGALSFEFILSAYKKKYSVEIVQKG